MLVRGNEDGEKGEREKNSHDVASFSCKFVNAVEREFVVVTDAVEGASGNNAPPSCVPNRQFILYPFMHIGQSFLQILPFIVQHLSMEVMFRLLVHIVRFPNFRETLLLAISSQTT